MLCRYQRCIKIRPDVIVGKEIHALARDKEYYFSSNMNTHSDILALTTSRTMDSICSFISRFNCDSSPESIQSDNLKYLSEVLGLEKAPMEYGKDWSIIRSSYTRDT